MVDRGATLDGLGRYLRGEIEESDRPLADVARTLRRTRTDILVSYLPVGSQRATEWYADRRWKQAAPSSTAFRSSSPPTPPGSRRFEERGLPIIGDDIKSQVGATIVHRILTNLFRERGSVSSAVTSLTLAATPIS